MPSGLSLLLRHIIAWERTEGRGERKRRRERREGEYPNKYSKINQFPKSPFSLGGIPRFRFLIHMAVMKDEKSAQEMDWGPSLQKVINKSFHFR